MPDDANKPLSAFGFLSVIEDAQHGFFGGYLIVSTWGRPIEFHCTTPVLPNPAQKILYGESLRPYLLGELIGHTLLTKAKTPARVVLTDQHEVLHLSELIETPIISVSKAIENDLDTPHDGAVLFNGYLLSASTEAPSSELLAPLAKHIDLLEPFQRIHEAIGEARRVSEPTEEQGDESPAAA